MANVHIAHNITLLNSLATFYETIIIIFKILAYPVYEKHLGCRLCTFQQTSIYFLKFNRFLSKETIIRLLTNVMHFLDIRNHISILPTNPTVLYSLLAF